MGNTYINICCFFKTEWRLSYVSVAMFLSPSFSLSSQDGNFTADEEKTGEILSTLKKLTAFHK